MCIYIYIYMYMFTSPDLPRPCPLRALSARDFPSQAPLRAEPPHPLQDVAQQGQQQLDMLDALELLCIQLNWQPQAST